MSRLRGFALLAVAAVITGCGEVRTADRSPADTRAGSVTSVTAPVSPPGWHLVHREPIEGGGEMIDVVAGGRHNAWITTANGRPLRRDGTAWRPGPLPPGQVVAPDLLRYTPGGDLWGFSSAGAWRWHRDRWTAHDYKPDREEYVVDAAVLGTRDVWLTTTKALRHWDGRRWRTVAAPAPVNLFAGTAGDDLWAVSGPGYHGSGDQRSTQPTMWHWNGKTWTRVPSPAVPLAESAGNRRVVAEVNDVVALAEDDVWAVGAVTENVCCDEWKSHRAIVLHWDGKSWRLVETGAGPVELRKVAPDGSGGIWITAQPAGRSAFLLHHAKGRWTRHGMPMRPGEPEIELKGIANVPGTKRMWAVAETVPPGAGAYQGLIFGYRTP
ncbi:hypothetical protein [Rhizohabitans arisaemae]|uniref:hypothetical protein n=1 Tax=Rhizohabitans arisaemae TaxID=2720610 RepID=UPI0024B0A891|nr:hypothetical protein [Rhizohabitans arisaemae]